ncbi:hypothetical protein Thiosp_03987 [Thiorhodovibrio litoralis]|nr:hypothetical protein Thiosp_03987 [Thiorhodovibrio litoralis]
MTLMQAQKPNPSLMYPHIISLAGWLGEQRVMIVRDPFIQ